MESGSQILSGISAASSGTIPASKTGTPANFQSLPIGTKGITERKGEMMTLLETLAGFQWDPVFYDKDDPYIRDAVKRKQQDAADFIAMVHRNETYCWAESLNTAAKGGKEERPKITNAYISINPIADGRARRNTTVENFCNWVVEFDGIPRTAENHKEWLAGQIEAIKPIAEIASGAVWSGGKSIHVWICCEESLTEHQWREVGKALTALCPGCDASLLKNPASWTRYPNGLRVDDEKRRIYQHLMWIGSRRPYERIIKHLQLNAPKEAERRDDLRAILLKEACEDILFGKVEGRNNRGFELAKALRNGSYSRPEARRAMLAYQETVCGAGDAQYSQQEALATLDSVYNRQAPTGGSMFELVHDDGAASACRDNSAQRRIGAAP